MKKDTNPFMHYSEDKSHAKTKTGKNQGLYTVCMVHCRTPTQTSCTIPREIPQNHPTFSLFHPLQNEQFNDPSLIRLRIGIVPEVIFDKPGFLEKGFTINRLNTNQPLANVCRVLQKTVGCLGFIASVIFISSRHATFFR